MSRTNKDREFKSHRSQKANPLGVCRCLQCSAVKRGMKQRGMVNKIKKHNRIMFKQGKDEQLKKGYYYA